MYGINPNLKPLNPKMYLAKPDKTIIADLSEAYNRSHEVFLGRVNTLEFDIPYKVRRKLELIDNKNIDKLKEWYLIKFVLGNIEEWYTITNINDTGDESKDNKKVFAFSRAIELNKTDIRNYEGESENCQQVMGNVLSETNWKVGYIFPEFNEKYRQFEISDKSVLDAIMEIAETFGAVVEFDTINRRVNMLEMTETGVFRGLTVSYGKYIKSIERSSTTDEMVTRLQIYGSGNLSINRVNPTGTTFIESFEYFLYPFERDEDRKVISHSDYMSDELCHAILDYQELVSSKDGLFKDLIDERETLEKSIFPIETDLFQLETELAIILDLLDVVQHVENNEEDIANYKQQRNEKQIEIDDVEDQLTLLYSEIDVVLNQIEDLQEELALENNFTSELIEERKDYIFSRTWVDENYTDDEELYTDGIKRFEEMKKPKTVFTLSIVDFLKILSEQKNWKKLNIGDEIRINYEKLGIKITAKIIEIHFNYDSNEISITIANVKELLSDEEKFRRLLYQTYSSSTTLTSSKTKWDKTTKELGTVSEVIENDWNAAERRIFAGVDESVEISGRGITITSPSFPNEILRATAGVLAMSSNGGEDWKTAITGTHIVAERIMGKLLAGENLIIENEAGKFIFDENGVVIDGSSFTLTGGENGISIDTENGLSVIRSDNKIKTILNSTEGISIQSYNDNTSAWDNKFYVDTSGELFAEDLIARRIKVDDGTGNVLIDAESKTIDFSGFEIITGKEDVLKGVNVKNQEGDTTFSVSEDGEVNIFGDVIMNGGQITWNNVNTPSQNELGDWTTKLSSDGIYTGIVEANQINANTLSAITADLGHINAGTLELSEGLTIMGGDGNITMDGDSFKSVDPTDLNKHIEIIPGEIIVSGGGITIKRPDDFEVISNGILNFDLNIQPSDPPFTNANVRTENSWYRTEVVSTTANCNYYTYEHRTRYMLFNISQYVDEGGVSIVELVDNNEDQDILFRSTSTNHDINSNESVRGRLIQIDLGDPTGEERGFFLRLATNNANYTARVRSRRRGLNG